MTAVILLYAMAFILLLTGVYSAAVQIFGVPSRAAAKSLRKITSKPKRSFAELLVTPLSTAISRLVKVPPYKRAKLKADLKRVGMDKTPEMYIADAWASALLVAVLAVPCWLMGSSISAVGAIGLAIALYFHNLQRVDKALENLDEQIIAELPHFVRSLTVGIESRLPLADTVAAYLETKPDTAMRQELLQLIPALGLENQRDALLTFDAAIGLPQMRQVIPVLIAVTEGTGDNGQLIMLANQMDALAEEQLQRELLKRPGKIKKATVAIAICAGLMLIVPLVAQIVDGFSVAFG